MFDVDTKLAACRAILAEAREAGNGLLLFEKGAIDAFGVALLLNSSAPVDQLYLDAIDLIDRSDAEIRAVLGAAMDAAAAAKTPPAPSDFRMSTLWRGFVVVRSHASLGAPGHA